MVRPPVAFEKAVSRLADTSQVYFRLGNPAGQLKRWPVLAYRDNLASLFGLRSTEHAQGSIGCLDLDGPFAL